MGLILLAELIEMDLSVHQVMKYLGVLGCVGGVWVITHRQIQREIQVIEGLVAALSHKQTLSLEDLVKVIIVKYILVLARKHHEGKALAAGIGSP